MKRFKLPLSGLLKVGLAVAAMVAAVNCTTTNYNLGSEYIPNDHLMTIGRFDFSGFEGSDNEDFDVLELSEYMGDDINMANRSNGYIGVEWKKEFGKRRSGFFTQYTPMFYLAEEEFGYRPILDSVVMYFSLGNMGGDTTQVMTYSVREVLDNSFLIDKFGYDFTDDDYLLEYDNETAKELFTGASSSSILGDVLFTFTFPDQANEVYTDTETITISTMTEAGEAFMRRLMLIDGDNDYTIYEYDSDLDYGYEEWLNTFKGLYISTNDIALSTSEDSAGATYGLSLENSGFGFYGRSLNESNPTMVKDTIGMTYMFKDTYYSSEGGNSINVVERDLTGRDTESNIVRAEGMGGIATQLIFTQQLFEEFDRVIAEANEGEEGAEYVDIFFNEAILSIYVEGAESYDNFPYDSAGSNTEKLNDLPTRLGLYTVYSSFMDAEEDYDYMEMTTATDYDYYTEYMYSTTSSFSGTLNRNAGFYEMNIPLQLQNFWIEYRDAKEENGGVVDWASVDWNVAYIAPLVDNLFSPDYAVLQGLNLRDGSERAPIRLEISYTLIRR